MKVDVRAPDPRAQELLERLPAMALERVEGLTFEDQDVHLDGREFIDCSFVRCRMLIALGWFRLTGAFEARDCLWALGPPVEGAVRLLDDMRRMGRMDGPGRPSVPAAPN